MKEKHVIHVLRQQDWNLTAAMKKTMRRNIGSFSAPPLWIPQLQQPDACGWRKATTLQCFIHMRHSIRELLLFLLLHALSLSLSLPVSVQSLDREGLTSFTLICVSHPYQVIPFHASYGFCPFHDLIFFFFSVIETCTHGPMKDFLKTIFCLNCQTQLGGWQRHYPLSPSKCDLISSDVVWSDRSFHHLVQFHVLFSPYVFVKTLKAMQHILWLRQAFWGQQHGAQWNPRLKRWSPKIGLFSNDAFQLQDFLFKLSEGIHDQRASQVGGNRLTWKSGYLETTVFFWFFLLWVSRCVWSFTLLAYRQERTLLMLSCLLPK